MGFNDIETKRIEKEMKAFIDARRPPAEVRDQVDLDYKILNFNVILFEIRPNWQNEKIQIPIAIAWSGH
jgi:hypothetical protein